MSTTTRENKDKPTENELAQFLNSLEDPVRGLLVKCLLLHGDEGDAFTKMQKIERLRSAL